jgi:hypothetical protein
MTPDDDPLRWTTIERAPRADGADWVRGAWFSINIPVCCDDPTPGFHDETLTIYCMACDTDLVVVRVPTSVPAQIATG